MRADYEVYSHSLRAPGWCQWSVLASLDWGFMLYWMRLLAGCVYLMGLLLYKGKERGVSDFSRSSAGLPYLWLCVSDFTDLPELQCVFFTLGPTAWQISTSYSFTVVKNQISEHHPNLQHCWKWFLTTTREQLQFCISVRVCGLHLQAHQRGRQLAAWCCRRVPQPTLVEGGCHCRSNEWGWGMVVWSAVLERSSLQGRRLT